MRISSLPYVGRGFFATKKNGGAQRAQAHLYAKNHLVHMGGGEVVGGSPCLGMWLSAEVGRPRRVSSFNPVSTVFYRAAGWDGHD